jgi:hypothetical protein
LYGFMASKVIEKLGGIETGQGKWSMENRSNE